MILDLVRLIEEDLGEPVKKSSAWLFWRCPFHADSNPSLAVKVGSDHWFCFGCRKSGNAATWLREYRKMNRPAGKPRRSIVSPPPPAPGPPGYVWQERARLYIDHWEKMLWSSRGRDIRWYLNSRGLSDDTLHRYRIGYNPSELFESMEAWGLNRKSVRRSSVSFSGHRDSLDS